MASKKNQEALNRAKSLCSGCPDCSGDCEIYGTLQKAIDDLEIYKMALNKSCVIVTKWACCPFDEYDYKGIDCEKLCNERTNDTTECWKTYYLDQARKELEDGK